MISWQTPTDYQVNQIIALINEPEQLKHFFDRLENPSWVRPLKERGLFDTVPAPLSHGWSGAQSYPVWPQSGYLARMSPEVPKEVFAIVFEKHGEGRLIDTANVTVRADLVDIALGLPASLAVQLVPAMVQWVREDGGHPGMRDDVAARLRKLMVLLARKGEPKPAVDLCKVLLAFRHPSGPVSQRSERTSWREEPEPLIDPWQYRKIVREDVAELADIVGQPVLMAVSRSLRRALQIRRSGGTSQDLTDYSSIWRPAVEPHEQNDANDREVTNMLISGLRDLADRLVETGATSLIEAVSTLGEQDRPVFQRLALYLLRRHGRTAPELVSDWLTNRSLFDEPEVHHEYTTLAADYFASLPSEAQETILEWVDAGPDRGEVATRFEYLEGRTPAQDDIDRRVRLWQWRRLAPIAPSVPGEWAHCYRKLVSEFGQLDHPEFLSYSCVQMGEKTPMTVGELRPLPVPDMVEVIRTWRATQDPFGPTVEGLAHTVGQLASEEPVRFAREAERFRGLGPPYVRHLMSALLEAVNRGKPFEWEPVLLLCKWVIDQPCDLPGKRGENTYTDPGWEWARGAIAHLLYAGLDAGEAEIPLELRQLAWDVILPLTSDPDPGERDYATPDDVQMASLNTVRGEAMHAVIRYALWVHRNLEAAGANDELHHGFDEMIEVRGVLEDHLDVQLEPSPAIRAVYGQWFAWLVLLDEAWASSHIPAIFPESTDEQSYWHAAWDAYVTMSSPYDSAWFLLRGEYRRAVDLLIDEDHERRQRLDPAEKLAEHLMVQYWRGNLAFGDHDGLLEAFFDRATDVIPSHAITYVGHILHNSTDAVAHAIVARLQDLWERRLALCRENPINHTKELAAFGWWFASGAFDDSWALRELVAVLSLTDHVDMGDEVVERLARTAPDYPCNSVTCLTLLVETTTDPWTIRHWLSGIRTILRAALESRNEDARRPALALIEQFGRRGHHDYRDLRSL